MKNNPKRRFIKVGTVCLELSMLALQEWYGE